MSPELSSAALGRQGVALRAEAHRDEALAALREAAGGSSAPAWVRAVLGEVLRELGGRRRGYAEIQAAVKADPECSYASEFMGTSPGRDEAWAFGCRGGCLRMKDRLEEAEADLVKAVDLDPGCGWAWGWLGEVRLRRGAPATALPALDRAVALFAESPEVFAWRGEARRLLGKNEEALRDLDQSIALGGAQYGVFLSRAHVRLVLGDRKGYLADLTEAVRSDPEIFKDKAKELGDAQGARQLMDILRKIEAAALLLDKARRAQSGGRPAEAIALLKRCAALDPGDAKARALSAEILAERRDFEGAFKEANEAVRLSPSADHYALRADISQKLGYMEAALRDLNLAAAWAPNAAMLRWRAQTFLGMRHYDLAIKDISAALELEPDDSQLFDLRAHVNLLLGRLPQSLEDVERALKIAPRSVHLHLRRGQIMALQKRFVEAHAGSSAIQNEQPAWSSFIAGYIHCVEKRYDLASAAFDRAFRGAGASDAQLKLQAGFYATVAKALSTSKQGGSEMAGKKKEVLEKGKVYLCGLGVFPPQTATVEVLRAISECDVIFNNLPGLGISEFLGLFCDNRRPVAFRYEQDAKLCADLVLSEVRPGRTAGFVTFGHPLLFGPLSHEIIKRCRKESIPCKAFGAVSSMDAVLAASGQVLGYSYGGYQLFETTGTKILEEIVRANPRLPMIVYFADGMSDEWLASLAKILSKLHGPAHRCLLYGPKHELWDTTQDFVTVKELAGMSHHKIAQGILFVPPRA